MVNNIFKARDLLSKITVICVWIGTIMMGLYFLATKNYLFISLASILLLLELNNEFNNKLI